MSNTKHTPEKKRIYKAAGKVANALVSAGWCGFTISEGEEFLRISLAGSESIFSHILVYDDCYQYYKHDSLRFEGTPRQSINSITRDIFQTHD